MGKATFINQHDWLAVRATFEGGVKANITWNRGGQDVHVMPPDSVLAEKLSLVVEQASKLVGKPESRFKNLGDLAEEIKTNAFQVRALGDYVESLKTTLNVSGERPKAKNAPGKTTATVTPNRGGYLLNAMFANGDQLDLKINRASVSVEILPGITSLYRDIGEFVFGLKDLQLMEDAELAETLKSIAADSEGLTEWFDNARAQFLPAARPL